jgi:hypothetical protein
MLSKGKKMIEMVFCCKISKQVAMLFGIFFLSSCMLSPYAPYTEEDRNFNEAVLSTFVIGKTTLADVEAAWGPVDEDSYSRKSDREDDERRRDGNLTRTWEYSKAKVAGGQVHSFGYKSVTLIFDGSKKLLGVMEAGTRGNMGLKFNVPSADLQRLMWKEPTWWKDPNWGRKK